MRYTQNNTKVVNCYKYTYKQINGLGNKITKQRQEKGLPVTRKSSSYANEIKVHKFLYHLGYKKSHTIDADLEENIDKKLEKIYNIIGRFL